MQQTSITTPQLTFWKQKKKKKKKKNNNNNNNSNYNNNNNPRIFLYNFLFVPYDQ